MAFQRDYQYGIKMQKELFLKLKAFFNDNLIHTESTFAKYDYVGDTTDYELKCRNNTLKAYPTTCIAQDKIQNTDRKQVFIFHFLDGTYYIPYDKEVFSTFEVKQFRRFRSGVNDKLKDYVYIPIESLKRIE